MSAMMTMTRRRGGRDRAAATLAVLATIAATAGAGGQMPPSPVRVDEARMENVKEMRRVTGDLRAIARSRVATFEEGMVMTLPVTEGQHVEKGQVLATIDSRRLSLQLKRAEAVEQVAVATLAEREAQAELSRYDVEKLRLLEQRSSSNPKELADAEWQLTADEARRDQARQQVDVIRAETDLLRTRLEDTTIIAPFDGAVMIKHTEVGQWIGEGDPVVEIVAIGAYDAWLDVPQRFADAIIGKDVTIQVTIEAIGRVVEPQTPRVVRQVDPTARTFAAIIRVDDEADALAPGMSVIGWTPTGKVGEHLTIDKDALLKNPTGYYVFVVREGRTGGLAAMPADVEVEFDLGERLAVRSAMIRPGDRIAVEGNERLFPTAPVTITTAALTEVPKP